MNRKQTSRKIGGITYKVHTMTRRDICRWLVDIDLISAGPASPAYWLRQILAFLKLRAPLPFWDVRKVVEVLLFDEPILFDICYMTSLSQKQVLRLTPRQLRMVWQECKSMNAEFFAVREAIIHTNEAGGRYEGV